MHLGPPMSCLPLLSSFNSVVTSDNLLQLPIHNEIFTTHQAKKKTPKQPTKMVHFSCKYPPIRSNSVPVVTVPIVDKLPKSASMVCYL